MTKVSDPKEKVRDCEHCEEEECENLSEQNRMLVEAIRGGYISEEQYLKMMPLIFMSYFNNVLISSPDKPIY